MSRGCFEVRLFGTLVYDVCLFGADILVTATVRSPSQGTSTRRTTGCSCAHVLLSSLSLRYGNYAYNYDWRVGTVYDIPIDVKNVQTE